MHVQWTDDLVTGYELVDGQHRELFVRLNRFIDALWEGQGKQGAIETLDFLGDYVVDHFGAEEQLMLQCSYPGYEAHRKIHQEFIARFVEIKTQLNTQGMDSELSTVVLKEVTDWLQKHIRNVDKKMVEFVRAHTPRNREATEKEDAHDLVKADETIQAVEAAQSPKALWTIVAACIVVALVTAALVWFLGMK